MNKYLHYILMFLLLCSTAHAADTAVSGLTADATPGTDSLLYTVDDPSGTAASRKSTIAEVLIDGNIPDTITIDAATALSANPADCAANTFADAIAANGDLTCNGVVDADVANDITINSTAQITTTAGVDIGTSQALVGTTAMTIGAGTQTVNINSSDWDIDATGIQTGMGTITSNGVVTSTGFTIGAAAIIESELETIDGITPGTAAASKAVVLDGSKDIATINSLTATTLVGALTGNASTSTALAANGANCNAGSYPLGVDASGAVESCTDATTEIDSVVLTHKNISAAHHTATTDTNANTICTGTAVYLDGDGNCDTLGGGVTSLDGLSDVTTSDDTSGYFLVADGSGYDGVAMSSEATLASSGAVTLADSVTVTSWVMGASTANTPAADDSDTSLATTAYVQGEINGAGGTGLTCSTGQCNVDLGTSIATTELVSPTGADTNVVTGTKGASGKCAEWNADGDLVEAASAAACGSGGSGATELSGLSDVGTSSATAGYILMANGTTFNAQALPYKGGIFWETVTNADDFKAIDYAKKNITLTGIACEVRGGGTVDFDLQIDDGTPADVNGTDITCTSTMTLDSSLAGDVNFDATDTLDAVITSTSSTTDDISIYWIGTYDD